LGNCGAGKEHTGGGCKRRSGKSLDPNNIETEFNSFWLSLEESHTAVSFLHPFPDQLTLVIMQPKITPVRSSTG
jgi:hypothetical protein